MPTTLTEWQKHLEQHFADLAAARIASGYPLFALEHGLTETEIRSIKELLRSRIASGQWLAAHWLVWVVYGTEFGYEYYGDEYWQSFEEYTPHWRELDGRTNLRNWFAKFQTTYSGVKPTGQWAGQFSIIAWPITHAILPRYLQSQFARTLYDLRYQLAGLEDLSPRVIGQYIAENAWDTSARFRVFLQQEELTGRLVLALLSNRAVEGQSPIYPPTLSRLVTDLETAQNAKEWLKETRRLVADRIEGARTQSRTSSQTGNQASTDRERRFATPDLRPRLMLRRSTPSTWSVVIEIPNFTPLVALHPELRRFLMTTRCKIAGSWSPAGALLSGPHKRVILKSWITTATPFLTFERSNATLEQFAQSEIRFSSGPNWLFRIGSDGHATEIVGRVLRPGREYMMLSETPLQGDNSLLVEQHVDCQGVKVAVLNVPDTVSSEQTRRSQQLGFRIARTVRIWPAGLPAKGWDGEGFSDWLTTDSPCFGLAHDYAVVQAFHLRLDNNATVRIEAPGPGVPVFIQLPPLPTGKHTLSVHTATTLTPYATSIPDGVVTLSVREPQPWVPGTTHHSGLFVAIDPPIPSLDEFLEGNVSATILGPAGHRVSCFLTLFGKLGEDILTDSIGIFDLPVTAEDWHKSISLLLASDENAWTYLESTSGQLVIKGDELGQFVLRMERGVSPLRWICRSHHGATTVRLVEDTGTIEPADCRYSGFQRPAQAQPLNNELVLAGHNALSPGGLFEARKGEFKSAVIVSPPETIKGLQGILVEPDLCDLQTGADQIQKTCDLLRVWIEAKLAGPLAGMRRGRVASCILSRIYEPVCGRRWIEAESQCGSRPSPDSIMQLQRSIGALPGFGAILRRDFQRMDANTLLGTEWFADSANRYNVSADRGLCEFALRFAGQPHLLSDLPPPILPMMLADIAKQPVLLRAARFVAVLSASENPAVSGVVLPRWKW